MTATSTVATAPARRRPRLFAATIVSVAAALAITFGVQWWREWPLRRAATALAAGDPARAVAFAEYYLDGQPDDGAATALKARALVALGEARAASELYEKIGAASPDDIHAWARAYLLQDAWSRAVQLLKQYLQQRPDDPDALHEIAVSLARLGLFDDALAAARRLAKQPGDEINGTLLEGILAYDMKDAPTALAAFRTVLDRVPEANGLQIPPHEVFLNYGNLLLKQGDAAAAIPWLEKSQSLRPTGATLYSLGRARAQQGDEAGAEEAWKRAVETDPRDVSSREALAEVALAAGRLDEATEWLKPLEAVATERAETAFLQQRLAAARRDDEGFTRWKTVADEMRRRQQRVSALENLMASAPGSPWAIALRAHRFAAGGNWREAADLVVAVSTAYDDEPFVAQLREAIRTRGVLPSLDLVPLETH